MNKDLKLYDAMETSSDDADITCVLQFHYIFYNDKFYHYKIFITVCSSYQIYLHMVVLL